MRPGISHFKYFEALNEFAPITWNFLDKMALLLIQLIHAWQSSMWLSRVKMWHHHSIIAKRFYGI